MKICENCGAQLADDVIVCPYCAFEVIALAEKEHQQNIRSLQNEAQKLRWQNHDRKKRAERVESAGTTLLKHIGRLLPILIPILLAATAISTFLYSKYSVDERQKDLVQLETYYEARDYKAMEDYLDNHVQAPYGGTWRVYQDLVNCAVFSEYWLPCADTALTYYREYDANTAAPLISSQLCFLFTQLSNVITSRQDNLRYQKDAGFAEIEQAYRDALTGKLLLTDEEIDQTLAAGYQDAEDYLELTKLVMSRLSAH
ncbi:MAG: zinc ribbon domain-containing protein [Lachnospiraceae bacterium]|nr:zinc ribbon domain-containing protein [Lachnospiraceae bacterium]